MKAKRPASARHVWEPLRQCWEERSEQYLISNAERMPHVQLLYMQNVATLMSQKCRLDCVKHSFSMISFLSDRFFPYYLISEYIDTLNCVNSDEKKKLQKGRCSKTLQL